MNKTWNISTYLYSWESFWFTRLEHGKHPSSPHLPPWESTPSALHSSSPPWSHLHYNGSGWDQSCSNISSLCHRCHDQLLHKWQVFCSTEILTSSLLRPDISNRRRSSLSFSFTAQPLLAGKKGSNACVSHELDPTFELTNETILEKYPMNTVQLSTSISATGSASNLQWHSHKESKFSRRKVRIY